ncbi:hypothetical protein VT930_12830 [Mycobacterium sherrisii]|uniref:hypothetical protein n=1 Tax=Mycobacterium sherrisii TaxID=243061 RepID=UPI002DDC9448|nr:hypothetical protein [Mycobacterium sherrisii]MEC4763985.1 hypothetical protein [Mycobacterium sherrisii]
MRCTPTAKITAAVRGVVAILAVTAAPLTPAAVVHASPGPPVPDADHEAALYGDPVAAAPFWRQQHASDCGEMAVADVVGEITGRQPTEQQITLVAGKLRSATGSGPIWHPPGNTDIRDLPLLLWHYWITADNIQTDITAVEHALAQGRKVVALVNAETIWNRPGNRDIGNHFVVVTGVDTRVRVVHLNDSGVSAGRDEQVPLAVFERAWAPNYRSAVVTR